MTENTYASCPFCGSEQDKSSIAESRDCHAVAFGVMCSGCGAWGPLAMTREIAWRHWSIRSEANVSLIAATDMLEALELVQRVIDLGNAAEDSTDAMTEWAQEHDAMAQAVQSALKKARGEK